MSLANLQTPLIFFFSSISPHSSQFHCYLYSLHRKLHSFIRLRLISICSWVSNSVSNQGPFSNSRLVYLSTHWIKMSQGSIGEAEPGGGTLLQLSGLADSRSWWTKWEISRAGCQECQAGTLSQGLKLLSTGAISSSWKPQFYLSTHYMRPTRTM